MNNEKTMRGQFITLEGAEGVGKSSILPLIVKHLQSKGVEVVQTREPGGTSLGEQLREVLLNTDQVIVPNAELLMMMAARAQHIEQIIEPALKRGAWVVCDRFIDSSIAYQGSGRELGAERVKELQRWLLGNLKIDLTLLLDVTRETSLARTGRRGDPDRIEKEGDQFFKRVRDGYLQQAKSRPNRIKVIDANPDLKTVSASVFKQIDNRIERWQARAVETA